MWFTRFGLIPEKVGKNCPPPEFTLTHSQLVNSGGIVLYFSVSRTKEAFLPSQLVMGLFTEL